MTRILAAAIQMNSQPDLERNMEQVGVDVARAAREGARLIALPENFAYLGSELGKHRRADRIAETVLERIPVLAREFGVYLLAGGFPVRTGLPEPTDSVGRMVAREPDNPRSRTFNRAIVAGPSGGIIAQYDKIHLFDITLSDEEHYRESALVAPGRPEAVVCDLDLVRLGLSICYDLRFPELYRLLSEQGADVLSVPAAFTRPTGAAHWETLLRARAIENTCYVIAPAQTGLHGTKRTTHGHSLIIDPWGTVLADAQKKPGVIYAEIDTGHIQEIRQKLPSLRHRKL